ncbi:Uma2 family endonuclease [Spongiactinospora rosea]|uniref:Uma2 family endonuclease n=1 Tax=Spongiactinospora rosea TaxID=2248750 RepID=A0A366M4A6_9ACTN|nr:Uma2 family endonuclease [Spongiactinospora rosea]RBQ20409.1 Uma2 family endonuclease [Spongiactinospora rosea]
MTTALPEWFHPGPPGGWTADMLDHLPPEAPRHVELIDGALTVRPPQTVFHMRVVGLLEHRIRPPDGLAVAREMTVTLGLRQRPEPDILVVKAAVLHNELTTFQPEQVHLVAEVVSDETCDRDRVTKPIKYADAGIRYLWRVEEEDDRPVAYTYELDPAVRVYVPTGIHHHRLRTYVGFEVDIDLRLPPPRIMT